MSDAVRGSSPRALSRLTGALYLAIMVGGMFTEGVTERLVVAHDAAATARSIVAHEALWRLGVAANVATALCDAAVATLLFILLEPVSRAGAAAATAFRIAFAGALAAGAAFLLAPLWLVGGGGTEAAQAQALLIYSLKLHSAGFDVALALFGAHLMIVGVLIARSTFLPRWLGWGLAVAGACYAANSFIGFVAPAIDARLFPWILLPGFLSEGALTLWLLIRGVDSTRWPAARPT